MSFTKETLTVMQLINGQKLEVPVYNYKGLSEDAPKAFIQANIHGAEVQGNMVILELMNYLKDKKPLGDITLIPFCNPYGLNHKMGEYTYGRFDPTTGANWNRGYFDIATKDETTMIDSGQILLSNFIEKNLNNDWSIIKQNFKLAQKKALRDKLQSKGRLDTVKRLAYSLQEIACQHDIVLDLHTGPKATRYLYSTQYAKESASYMGIKNILVIPPEFAGSMDEATFAPWCKLKEAFFLHGRDDIPSEFESYTVELGSEEQISKEQAKVDAQGIINYLKYKKNLPGMAQQSLGGDKVSCLLDDYIAIHADQGGLIEYLKSPGQSAEEGEVLAMLYSFDNISCQSDVEQVHRGVPIIAPKDGIVIFHSCSHSVHEGMELINMMTETRSI